MRLTISIVQRAIQTKSRQDEKSEIVAEMLLNGVNRQIFNQWTTIDCQPPGGLTFPTD